jgi:hypothetical protein
MALNAVALNRQITRAVAIQGDKPYHPDRTHKVNLIIHIQSEIEKAVFRGANYYFYPLT